MVGKGMKLRTIAMKGNAKPTVRHALSIDPKGLALAWRATAHFPYEELLDRVDLY
jgi:hypothetical protein